MFLLSQCVVRFLRTPGAVTGNGATLARLAVVLYVCVNRDFVVVELRACPCGDGAVVRQVGSLQRFGKVRHAGVRTDEQVGLLNHGGGCPHRVDVRGQGQR